MTLSLKKPRFNRAYFSFPYFLISAIFVILPLIILLVFSFRDADGSFTFSNFAEFFSRNMLRTFGRSLVVALLSTVFSFMIAFPTALILANSKLNKSSILVMLFILPMLVNSILRSYAMLSIFNLMNITNSYVRVVTTTVFDFFPFMLLPIYTAFVSMDESLLEASQDLGGSAVSTFLKVKLPLAVPGIVSGIIMVFMPTISTFAIKDIVVRSDPSFNLIGNTIDLFFNSSSTYGIGAAFSFILLVIIAVIMVLTNVLTKGKADVSGPLGGQGL